MEKRKIKNIPILILFTFFLSSCGLFSSNDGLRCDDLFMTDETGLEIGIKGDPSDQWSTNNPIENDSVAQPVVNAAYPNPVDFGESITLAFGMFTPMNVKIQMETPNRVKRIIFDETISAGDHHINVDFENSPNGCYRFDFFFDESRTSNAYGLVLVESALSLDN